MSSKTINPTQQVLSLFEKARMKKPTIVLTVLAVFAGSAVCQANILDASWYSANSTTLNCYYRTPFANNTLDMDATQHPGQATMVGIVNTDTPLDPTLTLASAVDNDTGFAWLGYRVNVYMSVPFTFVTPGPTVSNPPTPDWLVASVLAPAWNGSQYEGTLFFSGGTPVGIGDELSFLYSINFASSTHYAFTQEMIPLATVVPEPSAIGLMGIGALGVALRLRRSSLAGA
jgi:hypothetical protein